MPWMIPSHQAPVLPLKRWRPEWFSGLGLVLGTAAPDLAFVLTLDPNGAPVSHTLAGLFLVALPMVIVLHALSTWLVFPWLLPRLPGGPPLHLHALARSRPATDPRSLLRVAVSGILGAATHVFIDGFTHGDHSGWALPLLPALGTKVPGVETPLYDVLQVCLTIGLAALALREWRRMASALPPPGPGAAATWEVVPSSLAERRLAVGLVLAGALAGAVAGPLLKGAVGTPDAPKLAAYGAIAFATLAAVAGSLADRARRVMDR
ncbi:MAG TPA: DUF4184 family protein, partial [Vicinamibacteria bacterium]|nr:DUF4184 family protein [Vicinamibacteria bacterium]